MENGSRALVSCLVVAGLRLGFYSRNGKGDFRAACIFKSIVGSDRDGVLPGHQRRQAEVVMLDKRVADAGGRSHENPVAAVQAVLARSMEEEASRAVKDAGWPPLIFPEAGPTLRSSTTGGVLSTSKRSLSRSVLRARAGGFEGASVAAIFK